MPEHQHATRSPLLLHVARMQGDSASPVTAAPCSPVVSSNDAGVLAQHPVVAGHTRPALVPRVLLLRAAPVVVLDCLLHVAPPRCLHAALHLGRQQLTSVASQLVAVHGHCWCKTCCCELHYCAHDGLLHMLQPCCLEAALHLAGQQQMSGTLRSCARAGVTNSAAAALLAPHSAACTLCCTALWGASAISCGWAHLDKQDLQRVDVNAIVEALLDGIVARVAAGAIGVSPVKALQTDI